MKQVAIAACLAVLLFAGGCTKEPSTALKPNVPPKTFLWLFPDSSIAEGTSKQHVRWWGEDPDGIVKGFLFVGGKFSPVLNATSALDTIAWRWKTDNDSIVAFPLLTKRDTFDIEVRAVDNTFANNLPDQAVIRFVPTRGSTSAPFWDVNENGIFDSADVLLPTLRGAMDPAGASLGMPLLNQPPSVVWAQSANDPTVQMQQPETTYTAATFSWVGTDPDGDQTIASYELVLNDTSNHDNIVSLPGNVKLVSLVVPRSRSDVITGVQPVDADLWTGTFSTTRRLVGTIHNLRLDTLNTLFLRARDIAGDASQYIQLPGDSTHHWFVKNPKGKLLIISDYILADRAKSVQFYRRIFNQLGYTNVELLDIARGLNANQKQNSKFGFFVPPFIDPAFIYTLQLFDLVYWFTDPFPSLAVAQFPLYQYVRDPTHRGKVIFSTMFQTSIDPRGALTDFAPIDSVSSVYLSNARLLPTMGETKMDTGIALIPDVSDPADVFPPLRFGDTAVASPGQRIFSLYMRPIYRRSDARYIYHMQPDPRTPISYTSLATLNDLRSITSNGSLVLTCGVGGVLLRSVDGGQTWKPQSVGSGVTLNSVRLTDANNGVVVGDVGTIFRTSDGGSTWTNQSVITQERLIDWWSIGTNEYICGTSGLLIKSTNSGASWSSINTGTGATLRAIRFSDPSTSILVGDNGLIEKTTDGGGTWRSIISLTTSNLGNATYATSSLVFACGTGGVILRSTNAGESWSQPTLPPGGTVRGIVFTDAQTGIAVGNTGLIWQTVDGGQTWTGASGVIATQDFMSVTASDNLDFWISGTGGNILHSGDGGASWIFQPQADINVGVIDGIGPDGHASFVFLGLPLHYLDGPGGLVLPFLDHVIHQEFGF